MAKIIVVEDEAIVAMATKMMLTKLTHEMISTHSFAEEAVIAAKEADVDLILMDIKLKGELDGIRAAEEIRKNKNVPILFITGNSDQKTRQRMDSITNSAILHKPIMIEDLKHSLNIFLGN